MILSNLNITPTMQCNLKCELCGVRVPHYSYRPQMTLEEMDKTLKSIFQIVDRVEKLQITGGEPLMHPQLHSILEQCFSYEQQFDTLWFFSNCAVPLRDNVLQVLKQHKDKVMVHCSDYGVRPSISAEIIQALNDNEIPHKYLKYYGDNQYCDGWVDNGDFIAHHRTDAENEVIFKHGSHVNRGGSWYVRGGQMHWCGRSIRGTELGMIPLQQDDYLDIFDETTTEEEKREKLGRLHEVKKITACDYCNGYYGTTDKSQRYPAGGQMKC